MDTKDRMDGCVCANGAKVAEIVHPYCPAHVPPDVDAELASLRAEVERLKAECVFVGRAAVADLGPICEAIGIPCDFGDEPGDLGADVAKAIKLLRPGAAMPESIRNALMLIVESHADDLREDTSGGFGVANALLTAERALRWLASLPAEVATSEREPEVPS